MRQAEHRFHVRQRRLPQRGGARGGLLGVAARGLDRAQVSLSGYWARGRTEDRFQAEKREPIGKIL